MIFAFIEDGTLSVLRDLEEVRAEFEGVDVESAVVEFFDEDGSRLEANFIEPNQYGRFLGIFSWSKSGVYELVQSEDPSEDSIEIKLLEAQTLKPNEWFNSIEEVKDHFSKRNAKREKW
jgi:hypothetical protein